MMRRGPGDPLTRAPLWVVVAAWTWVLVISVLTDASMFQSRWIPVLFVLVYPVGFLPVNVAAAIRLGSWNRRRNESVGWYALVFAALVVGLGSLEFIVVANGQPVLLADHPCTVFALCLIVAWAGVGALLNRRLPKASAV